MRDDLTVNFQLEMGKDWRFPIQLLVFNFPNSGKVYISDRNIVVGGNSYVQLVEDWGSLIDSADQKQDTGETTQCKISILNYGLFPFTDYFLEDQPENVEVDFYQTFEGLAAEDLAPIDTFVIQGPIKTKESTLKVELHLLSKNMLYDGPVGEVVTKEKYPNALKSEIGKGIDLVVGEPGRIKTLAVDIPPSFTLSGAIMSQSVFIDVNEEIISKNPPNTGFLLCDDEIIKYTSYNGSRFNVQQPWRLGRGQQGTLATEHMDRAEISIVQPFKYIVGKRPLSQINNVNLDNSAEADPSAFTIYPSATPPYIEFAKKPRYERFSASSRDEEVKPNFVIGTTNALKAALAFDDQPNTSAIITTNEKRLHVKRTAIVPDKGQVISARIEVTHWPTLLYEKDYIKLDVDGIAKTFLLSRPNKQDIIDIYKEFDFTHDHLHKVGDTHSHGSDDPVANTTVEDHIHGFSGEFGTQIAATIKPNGAGSTLSVGVEYSGKAGKSFAQNGYFGWTGNSAPPAGYLFDHLEARVQVSTQYVGVKVSCGGVFGSVGSPSKSSESKIIQLNNVRTISAIVISSYDGSDTTPFGDYNFLDRFAINSVQVTLFYVKDPAVQPAKLSPVTQISDLNIKDRGGLFGVNDVQQYKDNEKFILDLSKQKPGKVFADKFDVTDLVSSRPWSWFQNRAIRIEYVDNGEPASQKPFIQIVDVRFIVEYRPVEVVYTNNVYCEPVALDSNRPDKVIELLLSQQGMPTSKMGSVGKDVPVWEDSEIWKDADVWRDGGQAVEVAGTPFDLAAQKYEDLGYRLDGIISAKESTRKAIKEITRQTRSRLIWNASKAKLVVREKTSNWVSQKKIPKKQLLFNAIETERQRTSDIVNLLNLQYQKNYIDGDFDAVYQERSAESIKANKTRAETWQYDLVRSDSMAQDLAEFEINQRAFPSTFFNVTTFLQNFDIEKTDVIEVDSKHERLDLRRVIVRSAKRKFGSGKNRTINLIQLLLESVNFNLTKQSLFDIIKIVETFSYGSLWQDQIEIDEIISFLGNMLLQENIDIQELYAWEGFSRQGFEEVVEIQDLFTKAKYITINEDFFINDFWFLQYESFGHGVPKHGTVGHGGVRPKYQNYFDGIRILESFNIEKV